MAPVDRLGASFRSTATQALLAFFRLSPPHGVLTLRSPADMQNIVLEKPNGRFAITTRKAAIFGGNPFPAHGISCCILSSLGVLRDQIGMCPGILLVVLISAVGTAGFDVQGFLSGLVSYVEDYAAVGERTS